MKIVRYGDIIVYVFVVLLAVMLFSFGIRGENGSYAEVNCGGNVTKYSLSKDGTYDFENNGIKLEMEIKNGEVSVVYSECPDKICMKTGKISKVGQMIVCAPANIAITVKSADGGDTDATVK